MYENTMLVTQMPANQWHGVSNNEFVRVSKADSLIEGAAKK
jgi:hypothetical protein